jgi:hypothetical protein
LFTREMRRNGGLVHIGRDKTRRTIGYESLPAPLDMQALVALARSPPPPPRFDTNDGREHGQDGSLPLEQPPAHGEDACGPADGASQAANGDEGNSGVPAQSSSVDIAPTAGPSPGTAAGSSPRAWIHVFQNRGALQSTAL